MPGFMKNKIFAIWEFNAVISIIKDERLARVKFSKITKADFSIEGDIQEWKINKYFTSGKCKNFPDTSFLKFLQKFSKVRFRDEGICDTLIKLYTEFSSRKPRISVLMNLVDETGKSLDEVMDGYKKLIEIHKNVECYDNYASFLENIVNDAEEANLIHRKRNVLNINNARNDYQNLENYGKDVGILLILCSDEAFGTIVYINEKASQILKVSTANANGISLSNFIPHTYGNLHEKLMKNLVEECKNVDISSHKTQCFVTSDGFLVESYVMIKLTVFHNSLYFLASVKPRSATNREVAIISEENVIINHLELFSHYLNNDTKDLKSSLLSDIIPLNIAEMQDYKPWIIKFNEKPLAFVRIKKAIKSVSFYCLLMIHNDNEIHEWEIGNNEDQEEFLGSAYRKEIAEKALLKHKFSEIIEYTPKEIDYLISSKENGEIQLENTSKPSTSKSSRSIYSSHSKQLLLKSKQKVRVLQWVLFIVILSVIITMIGILNYIIGDVSHTSKMSSLGDLGKLLYNLEAVTDSIRTLEKQIKSNSTQAQKDSNTKVFLDLLDDLDIIRANLLGDFDEWSFCNSAEIISRPIIPLWNFEKERPKIDYSNLYNTLSKFISNGKNMITEIALKQNYSANSKFLFLNGISNGFDYSNKTANEIINCEISRVLLTGTNIYALIIVGMFMLVLLILVICGFAALVSRTCDDFWNFLLNKGQISMARLKSASLDRLMVVHGIDYNIEAPSESIKNNRFVHKVKSNLYMKFMWRIFIFFLIAASYYCLICFHMYPSCETMMIKRPKLLNNFNAKRALIFRLSIFARECMSPYMVSNFQNSYDFPNPKTMLNKTYDLLKLRIKELKDENFSILMSEELLDRIYKTANSSNELLKYGSDASAFGITDEIYSISYKTSVSSAEYYPYIARINAVNNEILYEFSLADRDSKNIISNQLNAIINITIIYSIAVCVLFFVYYWPYFSYKVKQFNRLSVLTTILVMESE
ncbi:unnamed protein product [Blepharisma stoltei]|uniref:TmcB/TmcC TPR repeats domain-containing protein n=1 Tax=Blepharisma stoltei TaxID=1481888 RepID=A0AAU9J7R1_9CILI|nr:unnamed protein product [Blepharisma stoltei]